MDVNKILGELRHEREQIEDAINHIKRQLVGLEAREISSRKIGEMVMHELRRVDQVAYIRFASVYRDFKDVADFEKELQQLTQNVEAGRT